MLCHARGQVSDNPKHQLPVLTGNVKHFAAVEHLLIVGFSI